MPSQQDFDKSFTDGSLDRGLERSPQRRIQGRESVPFNFLIGGPARSEKGYLPSWREDGAIIAWPPESSPPDCPIPAGPRPCRVRTTVRTCWWKRDRRCARRRPGLTSKKRPGQHHLRLHQLDRGPLLRTRAAAVEERAGALDGLDHRARTERPGDPPARVTPVLGEAVHDHHCPCDRDGCRATPRPPAAPRCRPLERSSDPRDRCRWPSPAAGLPAAAPFPAVPARGSTTRDLPSYSRGPWPPG